MIPPSVTPIPPEMLDYVRQVAQEMRVSEDEAWAMIQGGEGGASTPPPTTGQPAAPVPQPPPVPTAAAAQVSRGRSGQPMPPSQVQPGNGLASMFMTPEEWQEATNPVGDKTLGGAAVSGLASLFGAPGRDKLRASEKSQTLGELAFSAFKAPKSQEETELAEKAMKGYNPLAPMGRQAQLDALAKKKTLGPTLWTTLFG